MTQRRHRTVGNGMKSLRGNSRSVVLRPSDVTINSKKYMTTIWYKHPLSGGLFTYKERL